VVSSMPCLVGEFFVVGNDPVDRLSDHVRNTMSENPLSSAADGQDFSLFIDGEDRVICGFLDDFVALAQFFHTDLPASLLWSIPTLSNTPTKKKTLEQRCNIKSRKNLLLQPPGCKFRLTKGPVRTAL